MPSPYEPRQEQPRLQVVNENYVPIQEVVLEEESNRAHTDTMTGLSSDDIKLYLDTARAEARASAAELAKSQAELRTEIAKTQGDIRAELDKAIAGVSLNIANMKTDLAASSANQTKWIVTLVFAAVAATATLVGLMKPASPPPMPQAPTVIYAQPGISATQPPVASPITTPAPTTSGGR